MTEEVEPERAPGPVNEPTGQSGPPSASPGDASPPADAPPAKQPGTRRPIIIIGAIGVFLAVVLFAVRNNVGADDLEVGTCFNIPDGTTVQTVERQACTDSHTGEVFYVGDYEGTSYPISLTLDGYVDDNCLPAFESYVGTEIEAVTDLTVGYFHPSRDGWDDGDRTVTCYVARSDEAAMTQSLKGSGAQ
jgi:hypothetical protein